MWRKIRVGELAQDPRNLKRHDDRNKAVVGGSKDEFGQVENYVVEMGTDPLRLLGGNMRAADDLEKHGPDHEVMICEVDVHGAKADKLAALLNRGGELSDWRKEALADFLEQQLDAGEDPETLGFDEDEIGMLCQALDEAEAAANTGGETEGETLGAGLDPFLEGDLDDDDDEHDSEPGKTYEIGGNKLRCAFPRTADKLRRLWTQYALEAGEDPGSGALQ